MMDLICAKCGERLYENSLATTFEYNKDILLLMTEEGKIDIKNAPRYMVYACVKCGFTRKISFEDYFISRQEVALKTLGKLRSDNSMRTLDHSVKYSEDSGVSFCGICPGLFDGDGVCTNDVIAHCTIRKHFLGN